MVDVGVTWVCLTVSVYHKKFTQSQWILPQSQGYPQFSSMGYGHAVTGSFWMVAGRDPSIGVTTL